MDFGKSATRILVILATIALAALSSFAITPAEHRAKIDEARRVASELLLQVGEYEAGVGNEMPGKEKSDLLRRLMPISQSVETSNGTVEASNEWMHDRLRDFDATTDIRVKAGILTEIEERLTAIAWSMDELEKSAARSRTKDQEKQKLSEILQREEYQKPPEQKESQLEQWLASIMKWISGWFPQPDPSAAPNLSGLQNFSYVLRIVLIGLVVLVLLFGLYKLAGVVFPGIKRKKAERREDRIVLGETIGADQSAETLFDEAEGFARSGDLRMAIRKGYVALLCELSDRKVIGLQRHKTNRDYLKDVRSNAGLHANMSGLTSSFERHWYGEIKGDETAWSEFREQYRNAISSSRV